jgi:predicted nucleic acid-binding protein
VIEGVLDANVLIDFSTVGAISILAEFFGGRASVLAHVRRVELAKGLIRGLPDPCLLGGHLWITEIDDLDLDEFRLAGDIVLRLGTRHRGEAESIAVCKHRSRVFCGHDTDAIKQAARNGVDVATTTTIVNAMVAHRVLAYERARTLAHDLANHRSAVDPREILPIT